MAVDVLEHLGPNAHQTAHAAGERDLAEMRGAEGDARASDSRGKAHRSVILADVVRRWHGQVKLSKPALQECLDLGGDHEAALPHQYL